MKNLATTILIVVHNGNQTKMLMKKGIAVLAAAVSVGCFQAAGDEQGIDAFSSTGRDAWITGKIEVLYELNSHLNAFAINTDVESGIVILTGMVDTDIDRDLAGELAKRTDGVVEVRNEIKIEPVTFQQTAERDSRDQADDRSFLTWVDDATTTAAVKSELVANDNTKGLQIDVDTRGDVVTLSGRVASEQEKQLAEDIARNTGDVQDVRNQLVVDPTRR